MLGQTHEAIKRDRRTAALRAHATVAELKLLHHLRAHRLGGFKFRRQHAYGPYILDFVCVEHRLVVEVDGGQHLESTRDAVRDAFLESAGFLVLRFWNHDVRQQIDRVLESILSTLSVSTSKSTPSSPRPSP